MSITIEIRKQHVNKKEILKEFGELIGSDLEATANMLDSLAHSMTQLSESAKFVILSELVNDSFDRYDDQADFLTTNLAKTALEWDIQKENNNRELLAKVAEGLMTVYSVIEKEVKERGDD